MALRILTFLLLIAVPGFASPRETPRETAPPGPVQPPKAVVRENPGDYVVIVHGLLSRPRSMRSAENYLHQLGYHTINIRYPSTRATLEEAAQDYLAPAVAAHCKDVTRKVHFVAHSMGSLAVRHFLTGWNHARLGRVILLAAPNQGAPLVDTFGDWPLIDWICGPGTLSLGTSPDSFPKLLPAPCYETGVIMGARSQLPFFAPFFEGPNDGILPVETGRVPGISDFLVVDASHGHIRHSVEVHYQIAFFLARAKFDHERPSPAGVRLERIPGPRATRTLPATRPVIFGLW
ncbi:MAG TPA: alpha/beta fold hydrolase [Verrucomicrobiales bacterium]|nr:alpha/beta fold hydrolase [Verrucomicrobiales bacterium]